LSARLAQLQESGALKPSVAARELALLAGAGPGQAEPRSGSDLFLTGAALPPTAPVGQHEQAVAAGGRLAPGFRLLGRYDVMALLGVGGMGQVYLVLDRRRDREIAIKVLTPGPHDPQASWPPAGLVARLRHELAINERLTHPQILRTYDLETDPDARLLFFTMEYIAGDSLAWLLQDTTPLPSSDCLSLLVQIAEALDYAHGQGVIHRDVKPSNVLVTSGHHSGHHIKLLDFGIALGDERAAGPAMGTAYYMAPEQLRGEAVTAAADLYALGVMAFQMLTGHVPQPGMPGPSALRGGGALPEGAEAALDAAVLQAMHWRPEQRFVRASAFVDALRSALARVAPPQSSPPAAAQETSAPSAAGDGEACQKAAEEAMDNVVPLVPPAARRAPEALRRLYQRIERKRPGWLEGGPSAPTSATADEVELPRASWALADLPPLPPGQRERLLLSRQGIPLASLIHIPPGPFVMGLGEDASDAMPPEQPRRDVALEGYWIARTPITNAAWAVFVQESRYAPPPALRRSYYLRHWPDGQCPDALRDHPVVWVSHPVVWAFCDFYGLSLPSEAQWEKAIRGEAGQLYPWGDASPDITRCNVDNRRGGVCAVGFYPHGASPYGVLGGVGNVLEWCADRWSPSPLSGPRDQPADDPVSPPQSAADRVAIRGGHYYADTRRLRATYRQGTPLIQSTAHTGFRPVLDWRK